MANNPINWNQMMVDVSSVLKDTQLDDSRQFWLCRAVGEQVMAHFFTRSAPIVDTRNGMMAIAFNEDIYHDGSLARDVQRVVIDTVREWLDRNVPIRA